MNKDKTIKSVDVDLASGESSAEEKESAGVGVSGVGAAGVGVGAGVAGVRYGTTLIACYVGYFVQAVNVNLLAIIFIPLREQYGLTYSQFGTLVFMNFITQLLVSVLFSKALDRVGTKPFILPALCACTAGLIMFALAPAIFATNVFTGFIISILLCAVGGGLLELCLSPIVDAIPSDAADSSKALAFLHSFYAWGQAAVVLITTALLYIGAPWRIIVILWILVPAADAVLFARAPIAERATGDNAMPIRRLLRISLFIVALVTVLFCGASEAIVSQYASAFIDKGLGISKLAGDILGLCGFAIFLGIGRLIYGLFGDRLNIHMVLIGGAGLAFSSYAAIVFSPVAWPALPVVAIALCGLFVSLLWPGTLAIASKGLPHAGASMFALLAASGSLGCSIGPWLSGVATDFMMRWVPPEGFAASAATAASAMSAMSGASNVSAASGASGVYGVWQLFANNAEFLSLNAEQFGLRAGLLVGAGFSFVAVIAQIALQKSAAKIGSGCV